MSETLRIGLYGGTFDPIHRGHLETVASIQQEMGWNRVLFIPAFQQPFKRSRRATSPFHRYAMTVLATIGNPLFATSPIELERGEVSYSVDTLEELRRQYPDAVFDWIIGEDNLPDLMAWKNPGRLFELTNFAVLRRGSRREVPPELAGRVVPAASRASAGSIVLTSNREVAISASEIRRRAAEGKPFADLIPEEVARYIERNQLYPTEVPH